MKIPTNFRLEDSTLALLSQLATQLETTRTSIVEQAIASYATTRLTKHSRLMSFAGALSEVDADAMLKEIKGARRNKQWDLVDS